MKRWLILCALCAAIGCGNSTDKPTGNSACLDRPTDLSRPPSGTLPCDLFPPR